MLAFPLDLRFKLLTISSKIAVRDATDRVILFVKQKAFKLKESVTVFGDESQRVPIYTIGADRVIDFSARYHIARASGERLATLQRRGMRSLWRANYEIEREGRPFLHVQEENPWVKLVDGFVGEIPIVGMFTGYLLHPAYAVTRMDGGAKVLRVVKQPAFFEGRYRVERIAPLEDDAEELAVLAVVMMLLLERSRG